MGNNDLPKPGIKFRATSGPGNFKIKLSGATRFGPKKNLRDNQRAIVDTVKKYERVIRIKGGLDRLQKRDAWLKIKKSIPKPTYADKYEIKEILKHLGRGATDSAKKSGAGGKHFKVGGVEKYLTAEQVKRNLESTMQRDELTRQEAETSYAAGKVLTKSLAANINYPSISGAKTRRITGIAADANDPLVSRLKANETPRITTSADNPLATNPRAVKTSRITARENDSLRDRLRADKSTRVMVNKNSPLARRINVGEDRSDATRLLGAIIETRGIKENIGITVEKKGFVLGEDKLPDNPKPKRPSAGIRPIGL